MLGGGLIIAAIATDIIEFMNIITAHIAVVSGLSVDDEIIISGQRKADGITLLLQRHTLNAQRAG